MKTTTLTPTLTQLTRLRFVNAFLVREDDGFTLVDTTMGGDKAAEQLLAAAREARCADPPDRAHARPRRPRRRPRCAQGAARSRRGGADARARRAHPRRRAGRRGQAARKLADAQHEARRSPVRGRPDRQPRGRREPGPHAGPRLLPRHTRPDADRRRRLHDLRHGRGHEPLLLALPPRRHGHLGQAEGSRVGAEAQSTRPEPARGRPRARRP